MLCTCERDHHVVEDDRHAVVEQGLAKHVVIEVRIHPNLPNRVKIFTPTYQTGLTYSLQPTKHVVIEVRIHPNPPNTF